MTDLELDQLFGNQLPDDYTPLENFVPAHKLIKKGRDYNRKKQTNHNQRVREYWQKQGYWVERLEGLRNVNGAIVKADYVGCFDFECTKPGSPRILVQVSSKKDVTPHARKMLGTTEYRTGVTRRQAVEHLLAVGTVMYIQWFDQPSGHGGKWETGLDPIDQVLIDFIDSGKRRRVTA